MALVRPPSGNGVAGHLWRLSDQLRTEQVDDMLWCVAIDRRPTPWRRRASAGNSFSLSWARSSATTATPSA
eukprot:5813403-Pyramimonas_sp.AAC.1